MAQLQQFPRFTTTVRARGEVSSNLSLGEGEVAGVDLKVFRKKRERKRALLRKGEKTVSDLIEKCSAKSSKQDKQKVSLHQPTINCEGLCIL